MLYCNVSLAEISLGDLKDVQFSQDGESILGINRGDYFELPTPTLEKIDVFSQSAHLTNLRVCKDTLLTVPVAPYPQDSSPWAATEFCGFYIPVH